LRRSSWTLTAMATIRAIMRTNQPTTASHGENSNRSDRLMYAWATMPGYSEPVRSSIRAKKTP
jgi:hypothetical protein